MREKCDFSMINFYVFPVI